jgi:3D (Asp-Asp-Asp) domain-containing protein
MRTVRYWPAVLGALLALVGLLPATVAADSASTLRDRASELTQQNANLAARARGVVLELYSLDSQLARERARLVQLRIRTAEVKSDLAVARVQLRAAKRSLTAGQRALARRLQLLYEQGDSDPVAVVLGAQSLNDAITSIDNLNRSARLDKSVIDEAIQARTNLRALSRQLVQRSAAVEAARRSAAATAAALATARAERLAYIADLRAQARLNATRIAALDSAARAAQARSAAVVTVTPTAPVQDAPAQASGRALTVLATGYSLSGSTATGLPVGWGVVAVDPSVIPLGTRLSIPGYGEGVAADVGGGVQGAAIDLWFPTQADARAWGRRTVTIKLG